MKKSLNILIVLAVLDLALLGALWYGYTSMQDIKTEESDLRAQLAEESQKGQKLKALRDTLAAASKDKEQLERYLVDPSDENQIQLISRIERLATTTGVTITTNSFDLVQAKPPALHGEFAVDGSWKQIYRFLRLIEEFPTRVVISRYDIHVANQPGKSDHWAGSIVIDFLSLSQLSS
jgi:Tfp pilus assembly protein PilO